MGHIPAILETGANYSLGKASPLRTSIFLPITIKHLTSNITHTQWAVTKNEDPIEVTNGFDFQGHHMSKMTAREHRLAVHDMFKGT